MDDDLTFCSSDKFRQVIASIEKSNAKVILCINALIRLLFMGAKGASKPLSTKKHKCLVFVNNPRSSFIGIMNEMFSHEINTRNLSNHLIIVPCESRNPYGMHDIVDPKFDVALIY